MRLTLRSLLAYLDDVLETGDAEQLGKKIEESRFASEIVQRIKSAIRRGQLPAPKPDGKGMGLDANTVAEYLDNVLPVERLPEFEKVCLDSDMHLAEAAACHQILTLVLGQKADVDPETRQRMYRIGSPFMPPSGSSDDMVPPPVAEPAAYGGVAMAGAFAGPPAPPPPPAPPVASAAAKPSATPPPSPAAEETEPVSLKGKPEVPDYLREPGPSLWPIAVVLVLTFLLAVAVLRAIGPFDVTHPLAGLIGIKPQEVVQGDPTPPAPAPPKGPTDPMADPKPGPKPGDPMDMPPPTPPIGPPPMPGPPPGTKTGPPVLDPPPLVLPPVDPPPVEPRPVPMPPVEPRPTPPVTPVDPLTPPAPAAAVNVGVYSSEDEVLLRLAADGMNWQRLATRAAVQSSERLHAPPTFRPQLILGGNLQATLAGAASVMTLPPDARGVPRLELAHGRLVLVTLGMPGAQLSLSAGGREAGLAFADADAACAVEFSRYHEPGTDPLAAPAHRLVQIFVTGGAVTVSENGEKQAVSAGHVVTLLDDEPAKMLPAEAMPDWIAGKDLTEIDRKAAKALKDELETRPVTLVLRELVTDRRAEVRSLAVRSLGYVGDFESYTAVLNDVNQRSSWQEQFDALQACAALSPDFATRIRQGFEKTAGDDAAALYRLLWGYSAEDLRAEGGKKLVEQLDHQTLAVRVLAFENLLRITGGMTQLYRPEHTAVRRRPAVTKWREKANSPGGIAYVKPTSTPPRPAATAPETPDPPPVAPLPTVPPPAPAPAKPAPAPLPGE